MMRSLQHQFVQYLPEKMEPGILYISLEYVTASHLCCCGCGEEVVTPFSPVSWRMTFDGETISLWPSIGNWKLRCRSHYVIDRGRVVVAGAWTDKQVATERLRDLGAKTDYYGKSPLTLPAPETPMVKSSDSRRTGWLGDFWRRWFGK